MTRPPTPKQPSPGPDHCPRCGGRFACGAAGPAPCACFELTLSAERQAALGRRWSGCLCLDCLRLAAAGALDGELQRAD